jgi:PAS domain S-box-containing protein
VPHRLTDLHGWTVGAEDFLAAVLETMAQPIWVVDPDGLVRFANPAAVTTLGYDSADELVGRPAHETIHHSHPDGTPYPAAECPILLPRATGETVTRDLDWFVRRDGSLFPVSYVSAPIDTPDGRGAVVAFADASRHEHGAIVDREQAGLRRVATLVAEGVPPSEVFAAVAEEVSQVLSLPLVEICRYEPDGSATVIGAFGDHPFQPGTNWKLDGPTLTAQVRDAERPARVDDYADVSGSIADTARAHGVHAGVGAPVVVDGRVWGVIAAGGSSRVPLPPNAEDRLVHFTELVAIALSNTQAHEDLQRLADEQAALRRIATLVAEGADPIAVFDAVCRETGRLLPATTVNLTHFTPDGFHLTISGWSLRGVHVPTGTHLPLDGDSIDAIVYRSGAPARCDTYEGAEGEVAALLRRLGIKSEVAAPVVVQGEVWGALIAGTDQAEPLPTATETRLAGFAELIATAVSNATARSELLASRARIVQAADEQRRRVVRDLHDGAQQRLVHAVMTLQLARHGDGPQRDALLDQALSDSQAAIEELRELAHGLHPAILTHHGLAAAVESVADRAPLPVAIDMPPYRYPADIELAAYFVVAETLTNIAKYANAATASVSANRRDNRLVLTVQDDGTGGAAPTSGGGLSGLEDRMAALGGTLSIDSPRGRGTTVRAELPLAEQETRERESAS